MRPVTAGVAHAVDDPSEVDAVHLAAVLLCYAAPGRQGAVVSIATICLEAQLPGGALCHNELKRVILLQDGAVEATQVVAQQRGEEKV